MDNNYLLTYKDSEWQIQYGWFETEEEVIEFIDNNIITEVIECIKIKSYEDLTEKLK